MKIPIIRKGEYDIWSMRMRQYICHTDHNLWDVIVNGDLEEEPTPTREISAPPAPKTAKQLAAKRNQERVKSILLLAIPDEYLLKVMRDEMKSLKFQLCFSNFGIHSSRTQARLLMKLVLPVENFEKTGRNMDFKEKRPVSLDKSKIECYNCHRKGHFARECRSGRNQGKRSYGDNGRSNAPTNESSSQALVAHMNFDSEREKHSRARLEIQGYELALESLESRILRHEKNELAWGEKYEFQNYELKSSNEESTPANDRSSKADGYYVVPPPITGNFLTPRANILFAGLDEYAIRKKIIEDKSIIEDWNLDDEDDVSEVQPVSPVKTNEIQIVKPRVDKIGNPETMLQDHAVVDRGCLKPYDFGNKALFISDYERLQWRLCGSLK
ncbi:ribonuclease H-like domain-containing protein [Tanacetum coccineum]